MELKICCPICDNEFKKENFVNLLRELERKINSLSSTLSCDIPRTMRSLFVEIYKDIKYAQIKMRPLSNMMESQNSAASSDESFKNESSDKNEENKQEAL